MSRRIIERVLPAAWIAGAAGLYTLVYGRHGYSGADEGFITGLGWRVLQGEVPYRDFIYVRPPVSPLLHAVPLLLAAGGPVVLIQRLLCYAALAAAAWAAVSALGREFRLDGAEAPGPLLLATVGLVVSVQSFPPMPWHTVDGVLLGALGIAALARARGAGGQILGTLAVALAAGTKQSFAPLVVLALGWLAVSGGRRALAVGVATLVALAGTACALLAAAGALAPALEQTTGQLGAGSLLNSGLLSQLRGLGLAAGPGIVLWAAADRGARWLGLRSPGRAALPWFLMLALYAGIVAVEAGRERFGAPPWNHPALLLVVTLAGVLYDARDPLRARWLLGLSAALAWCASLSWGYQTPALFATPLVFGVLHYARRWLGTAPRPLALGLLAAALVAQAVAYRHPYREAPRAELTADLGAVFPELAGIRTSEEGLARWIELVELRESHARAFVVLPARPAAHWLLGERSPLAVDWAIDAETAGRTAELLAQLERAGAVALIERDSPFICASGPGCSSLAAAIAARWPRIASGRAFDVHLPGDGGAESR